MWKHTRPCPRGSSVHTNEAPFPERINLILEPLTLSSHPKNNSIHRATKT